MKTERVSSRVWGAVLWWLVILSLVTAEFTWLVQPVHAEEGWPPWYGSHVRLNARIVGHRLQISGAGFPIRRVLAVRVRLYEGGSWDSQHTLRTSRRGKFSADLPLPHRLENANRLRVCVKDMTSSRLTCATARRY